MRTATQLISVLLFAATTACASDAGEGRPDDVESDWRTGGKGDGETCDFDQMTAATFYDQFAYSERVEATGSWYRVGGTWSIRPTLDNGNQAKLKVYFLAGGRVIAEYREEKPLSNGTAEVLNETVIVTRATVDAATRVITLEGVGSGTPHTVRDPRGCAPGIFFKFSADIRSPGIIGDAAVIQSSLTSAYVIDPDHLDQVPNATARRNFEEDVANGTIVILRM